MLTEICGYLRNWFDVKRYNGTFTITDGRLITPFEFTEGQYIRIVGSVLNDGIYLYSDNIEGLRNETFDGAVWGLAIPKEVVKISDDINTWVEKNGGADSAANSPFTSESFGGYSYSKGTSAGEGSYAAGDWKSAFASRLAQWRKI